MLGFSLKQQTEWAARIHILPNQKPQIRTSLNTATHLTFPSFPISGQVAVRLSPSDPFPMLQSEDCLRQTHIYYAQVVLSTKHIRNIRKVLSEGETKQVCPCLNLKRTDSHSICIYLSLNASLMDKTYAIFISTVAIACVYINTIYIYIYMDFWRKHENPSKVLYFLKSCAMREKGVQQYGLVACSSVLRSSAPLALLHQPSWD